ncbi:MAG: hypothetical protein COA44_03565 [Arcobacter sp.]|nr:MAG: hypothetical protein COA44_03565 [Arcobacter sp.]
MVKTMKIALISDIHANAFYFKSVLVNIKNENVDKIICLGDLVGYYDEPNEVIDLCRNNNIMCLEGNHEEYTLETKVYAKEKEELYRIKVHNKILTKRNRKFIEELPKEILLEDEGVSVYCTHALPQNSSKYIYNPNDIEDVHLRGYDYYCSGHTHIPYIHYKYGTCLVNPGSVGQPRDYTTLPSYAIINLKEKSVSIKKVEVDVNAYMKHLEKIKLHLSLRDILVRKNA